MKTSLLFLLVCISCLCCFSCKKNSDSEPQGVTIRIKNASPYQFESVYVNTSGGENNYGALAAGQSTPYLGGYKLAYNYAYIKVIINGEELVLQPIDYVGETPIKKGSCTYIIGVADLGRKGLSLQFEKP